MVKKLLVVFIVLVVVFLLVGGLFIYDGLNVVSVKGYKLGKCFFDSGSNN